MKLKLILGLALVLSGGLINCAADTDTSADVTNILRSLFTDKILTLSSRQTFIIQTSQYQDSSGIQSFAPVNIVVPRIQQFGFKSQLSLSSHPSTVMQVAADENHATVLIETSDGQPYCLMADHLLVICDPDNPGDLAYYDKGTVLWGFLQSPERTNTSYQVTFMPTNVPPAAILDLCFVIKGAFAKMTNASYEAGSRTIRIQTTRGSEEIQLSNDDPFNPFGLERLKLNSNGTAFDFSDFQIETKPIKGLFQFSKQDLQKLNLPLRELDAIELSRLNLFIPEGFPATAAERNATGKLQELIKSGQ